MNKMKCGKLIVWLICGAMTILAFFARDFVLYDFHMEPGDYAFTQASSARPNQAVTDVWFAYGDARELIYGRAADMVSDAAFYAATHDGAMRISLADMRPIREDLIGFFIAALPGRQIDADGDGLAETVYDLARADLGPATYELAAREFNLPEIPFEVAFAERNVLRVSFEGRPLANMRVSVTEPGGAQTEYSTDESGFIVGLPIRSIREGVTVSFAPDEDTLYRMYYVLEDYAYFTPHFWEAHAPLLVVLVLTALLIALVCLIRAFASRRDPKSAIYGRERPGLRAGGPATGSGSRFMLIRWLLLMFGFFFWTYAGKIIGQGQALNQVAIPVFSCPFNLDQVLESSCYYFTHLPVLFTTRGIGYILMFLVTLALCLVFLGRILCGFVCPLGFVQDLMDKLRAALHIRPIPVTDRLNRLLQPIKWVWIILFLCFCFTGGDFCDICPNKVFSPALGGYWVNLALGGFLSVAILAGSFFIRRFWCLICPLGYLLGIFRRFNLFKLKKGCEACTECGACYEACPMRLKNVYKQRDGENVQTADCLMCGECVRDCPEDDALRMTFCGKTIYRSSREGFMSRYAPKRKRRARK